MGNIIKMDFYRMFRAKSFIISNIILFFIALSNRPIQLGFDALAANLSATAEEPYVSMAETIKRANFAELLSDPFVFSLSIILVLIPAVVFSYADLANGFIKNIAGQVSNKGYTVVSKFVVLCVHNLIFMFVGVLGNIFSVLIVSSFSGIKEVGNIGTALATFAIKWLLLMALTAILLFFTTGLKNKTLASVIGVIFGSGALSILHLMIDDIAQRALKFNPSDYDPTVLMGSASANVLVVNAIVVSLVVIAIFIPLTVKVFNKTDVK